MNRLFLSVLIVFSLLPVTGVGQNTDALIHSIKAKYQQLQKNVNQYKKDSFDLPAPSEGGMATVWHTGKEVKIIKAVYYYESGKAETNYYFDSSRLFFVLKKQYTYNVPFYITEKASKETNAEVFDDRKTKVQEERFYFNRNSIILWISGSKPVNIPSSKSKSAAAEILKEATDLKRQFAAAGFH